MRNYTILGGVLYYTADEATLSGLKSSQGIIKGIAKLTVRTVCMVGGSTGGVALGGIISGGNPVGLAAGGAAGAVAGYFASVYIMAGLMNGKIILILIVPN